MNNGVPMRIIKIIAVIFAIFVGVFGIAILQAYHHKPYVQGGCIVRLKIIDAAKDQWALENHKSTNDTPAWSDLQPFLPVALKTDFISNGIPACPSGGFYTIGRVGQPPTCSIGGEGHSLPKK
jgi:hypothetical protein